MFPLLARFSLRQWKDPNSKEIIQKMFVPIKPLLNKQPTRRKLPLYALGTQLPDAGLQYRFKKFLGLSLVGLCFYTVFGCEYEVLETEKSIPSSTIMLQLPEEYGEFQRPAVEFNHGKHTQTLKKDGCKACHKLDKKERLILKLVQADKGANKDDLMDLYHDKCLGCHKERTETGQESGPVTCGKCHIVGPEPVSIRQPMKFDYSLHYRHVRELNDQCGECHHVYNEDKKELEYVKDKEDACVACHGDKDEDKKLSLKNASHKNCIKCHTDREAKNQETGPKHCAKCHDAESQAKLENLSEIPRLKRGQHDKSWIQVPKAMSNLVYFDHQAHETKTDFCTQCHHKSVKPCKECHTLTGSKEGDGITLEQAYHTASSEHSCVGCHKKESYKKDCAGCHHKFKQPPSRRTCKNCHSGPRPGQKPASMSDTYADNTTTAQWSVAADAGVNTQAQTAVPQIPDVNLATLPVTSDDFPENVTIDSLVKKYAASEFPHRKIVTTLDTAIRKSKAAKRFHGTTQIMCTGCHHSTPEGSRPAACRACHSDNADAIKDKPGLRAAYHRQCIGCHQKMRIKAQGCEDCHKKASQGEAKEASKEVQQ